MMPELFIPCLTCKERGVLPSKEYPYAGVDCPTCLGRRFVRYGTEPGHEHVWITWCYPSDLFPGEHIVMSKEQFFQVPWMAEPEQHQTVVKTAMFCMCGKTAAEVML